MTPDAGRPLASAVCLRIDVGWAGPICAGSAPQYSFLLVDQAFITISTAMRTAAVAVRFRSGLEHVEFNFLNGELDVLHIISGFQASCR